MTDTEYATKLFSQLDRLDEHYRRFVRLAFGAIAMLAFGVLWFLFVSIPATNDKVEREADRTTGALCALRGDLEQRAATSVDFIRHHPEGFAGLSVATIRKSLADQRRTIAVLQIVKCP